jgi:hypothetical protein
VWGIKLFIELLLYSFPFSFFVVPAAVSDVVLVLLYVAFTMVYGGGSTSLLDSSDGKKEKQESQW